MAMSEIGNRAADEIDAHIAILAEEHQKVRAYLVQLSTSIRQHSIMAGEAVMNFARYSDGLVQHMKELESKLPPAPSSISLDVRRD